MNAIMSNFDIDPSNRPASRNWEGLSELDRKRCSGATLPVSGAVGEVRGWTRPALRPHWTPTLECL